MVAAAVGLAGIDAAKGIQSMVSYHLMNDEQARFSLDQG
jgi:hypothetical protein